MLNRIQLLRISAFISYLCVIMVIISATGYIIYTIQSKEPIKCTIMDRKLAKSQGDSGPIYICYLTLKCNTTIVNMHAVCDIIENVPGSQISIIETINGMDIYSNHSDDILITVIFAIFFIFVTTIIFAVAFQTSRSEPQLEENV